MQILKPHWISHDGLPIFCVDIHSDNSRFVTGGQGTDSGRLVVWNFDTVLNEASEFDENIPKMLCQIDCHQACVNCVRWSNSGKYFASGGDDKLVMIWSFAKYPQGNNALFSKGKVNVETWRCTSTLRGHNGDVLDVAWSPQDIWLASASVDNTIIIWDTAKLPEITAVLKGHTGLVKGISWDPIGKYLSSQAEDKSLRIWRTIDWQTEITITEPYEKCGTTVALRHDWSPDGQYLVSAHAMNNCGPTARIIERDGWKHDKDYVGHRKAVNCIRFSDNIVRRRKNNKELQMCVCALGSRDNGISVWLTGLLRPVVALENLFTGPVLDLAWSTVGYNVLACSFDGSVALLKFDQNEIGQTLTKSEKNKMYEKVYGTSTIGLRQSNLLIIENPTLENLADDGVKSSKINANSTGGETDRNASKSEPSTPVKTPAPINRKQIETRTSDGRRRITPICVAPAPDIGLNPTPFKADSTSAAAVFSSSSEEKSTIVVEKREDIIVQPNVTANVASCTLNNDKQSVNGKLLARNNESSSLAIVTAAATTATATISTTTTATATTATTIAATTTMTTTTAITSTTTTATNSNVITNTSLSTTATVVAPTSCSVSSPAVAASSSSSSSDKNHKSWKRSLESSLNVVEIKQPRFVDSVDMQSQLSAHDKRINDGPLSMIAAGADAAQKRLVLPPMRMEDKSLVLVPGNRKACLVNETVADIRGTIARVKLTSEDTVMWEHVFGSKIIGCVANNNIVVVTLDNRNLFLLDNESGKHLLPPLVLAAKASHLMLTDAYLLCITCTGTMSIWDVVRLKVILSEKSLIPLFTSTREVVVTKSTISPRGIPMLALSNGKSYMYSIDLECWLQLGDNSDAVVSNSLQKTRHNVFRTQDRTDCNLPLHNLQSQSYSFNNNMRVFQNNDLSIVCTYTFLEQQISASLAVESSFEFRHWLLTLVQFLLQQGDFRRIRSIFEELLGPCHKYAKNNGSILGLSKRELLKDILTEIGSNVQAQRLFIEFSELMNYNVEENS